MKFTDRRRLVEKGFQACDVRLREVVLLSVLGMLAALFKVLSMSLFLPLVYAAFSDSSSPRGRFSALFKVLPLEDVNLIYVMSGAILFAGIAAALLSYLTEYLESRLLYHGQKTLSRRVFRRFLSYGQAYSDRQGPDAQLRELRRVPRKVARQVKVLSRHLRAMLEVLVYSAALLFLSWPAALACYVVLTGYYIIFGRLAGLIDASSLEDDRDDDLSEDRAADILRNLPLVRGAGTAREEKREWRRFQQQRFQITKRAVMFSAAIKPAQQLLTMMVMLVFVLVLSLGLGDLEAYDVVRFIVFFLFFRRLMTAFSKLLEVPEDWSKYVQIMEGYLLLMERADKGIVKSGSHSLGPLQTPIEINNLDFSYGDTPALKHLNVSFPLNKCTVAVGLSGSGKSTLLKLLTRQYEINAGRITLNGQSIGDYTWESLSNEIVHLGPEPQFFNKSIEYNLCYGIDDVVPDEIFAALEGSDSADFISSLESGLQTLMGMRGQPFSRGQLQRLGIARLLMQRQGSLFLLDEATSALDEVTEKSILRQMASRPNTTIIFVTHRATNIDPDMHVVVFDQGQVVEQGARKELESRADSYFSRLCHTDFPISSSGC